MYFHMQTDGNENIYFKKQRRQNAHVDLGSGILLDIEEDDIELPYKYKMMISEGQEPDFYGWFPGVDLMHEQFIKLLVESGVDNLQVFPAEIRHPITDEIVPGYATVNIVGHVSCANIEESDTAPLADVYYFENLVIDPTRTQGLLIFRVEESPMVVLVHESLAKKIQAANIRGILLDAVSESTQS